MASGRCAFSCKRQGEARADVLTLPGASLLDNIRALYGAAASKPFLYLDLRLPPRHVDVNTHPTKREVGFIHQEEITSLICEAVESTLSSSNTSRTLSTLKAPLTTPNTTMAGFIPRPSQTQMSECASLDAFFPGLTSQSQRAEGAAGGGPEGQQAGANPKAAAAAALTGSLARKRRRGGKGGAGDSTGMGSGELPGEGYYSNADIDNLVHVRPEDEEDMERGGEGEDAARVGQPSRRGVPGGAGSAAARLLSENLHSCLDSIQGLAAEVDAACHSGLAELMRGHVYVGMADETRALLQYRTKLYIVDLAPLSRELFYQQVLAQFEAVESTLVLDPAPSIRELMAMALALEQARGAWEPEVHDGVSSEQELCELVALMLMEKSPMLEEYLGMRIDDKGCLCSLPLLLPGWQPDLGGLCDLMMGLARDVVWEQEQPCFRGLAQVLADFLALKPPLCPLEGPDVKDGPPQVPAHIAVAGQTDVKPPAAQPDATTPNAAPTVTLTPPPSSQPESQQGAQVLLPAMRSNLRPSSRRATDGTCVEIAALERLYRIFERC
ncbi:hypothetical protein DUNSADRAFT_11191 [Dunaliella salina]|uniref:DNA mismatch repair protein S5 domain-containing protein n=2 Tax=Dunaliella salina TaxID=3046 RepID=A0ABQ7GDY9_DUNSA|nr:hypothetical protein DUNSADRAFT_11191 [Dunaliella salina]|eukprot:KAF5832819.1 hypothetical protein DUNSADRAFT_11191 [Dunaliella salina]